MTYLDCPTLLALHVHLMRDIMHETYYGVLNEGLLQSALARPRQASQYEQACGLRQAAYLFQGVLMNYGFAQGNKRTAFTTLGWFLNANDLGSIIARPDQVIHMCLSAENETWSVDRIEAWLTANVRCSETSGA
ncbi:MAG: Fic family protein [Phycisphaerales bacterium]|nr:Fic family protein [Phycisphaerales bacterium]